MSGVISQSFVVETPGRGTTDLTQRIQRVVKDRGIERGLCMVFVHHTSASVIICENADDSVRRDLERWMAKAVVDGDALFEHDAEGPDDMPAHVRTILTSSSISIPISDGRCDLGTWQGIYLWEHRRAPHRRRVTVTVLG